MIQVWWWVNLEISKSKVFGGTGVWYCRVAATLGLTILAKAKK